MANRFLNNIRINDAYTFPASDGTNGQVITTDGSGNLTFADQTGGAATSAESLNVTVKNVSGGSLSKGTIVHAAPTATPPSGNVIEVIVADYDTSTDMPAIAVLNETIANEAEGEAIMFGAVSGIDTSSFSIGDELWVGNNGAFTNTKPATAGQLIQKIAVVIKSHASNGLIKVFGAGRTNDVPLPLYIDNTNQRVGIGASSPDTELHLESNNPKFTITNTNTTVTGYPGIIFKSLDTTGAANQSLGRIEFETSDASSPGVGASIEAELTAAGGQTDIIVSTGLGGSASERMRIDSSGNVGIGTASPATDLDISSADGGKLRLTSSQESWTAGDIISESQTYITDASGIGARVVTNIKSVTDNSGATASGALVFETSAYNSNASERMRIDSSGNVGIGASNPSDKLVVIGDIATTATMKFTGNSSAPAAGAFVHRPASNELALGTASTERIRIDSSGQVGIGTTTPGSELDVNGTITASRLNLNSTSNSSFLTGNSLLSANGYIMVKGIVNTTEAGSQPAAIVFGNGSTYGSDKISLVTSGATRLYVDNSGNVTMTAHRENVSVISTNTSAVVGQTYVLTASLTLTLPASPTAGDKIKVSNMSGTTTPVIARNGSNIMGLAENLTLDVENIGITLVYSGDATKGWVII